MKLHNAIVRRSAALVLIGVMIVGALTVAPMGALSQSGDGPTPSGEDGTYVCSDFDDRQELGEEFDPDNDVNDLDRDDDGIACESLGSDPTSAGAAAADDTATETATGTATEEPTDTPTETATDTDTATETLTSTASPTETATATETPTETATDTTTDTETQVKAAAANTSTETETATETEADGDDPAYYQVDFVTGEPIENLRSDEGYYTPDQLVRFAHGNSDDGVTRVSDGEFITNETMADRIESENITVEDGTATITFTVSEGDSIELTLASYEKTGPGWNPQTEAQQEFVDNDTEAFESGTHTLTVELPDHSDE